MKDVKLKPAEIAERSNTLAALIEQILQLKSDAAEIASDYKKRVKSLELESVRLARVVRTGVETVDNQMQLTGKED